MAGLYSNRRRFERISFTNPVRCITTRFIFHADSQNLSLGGMCIQTANPLLVGEPVTLIFNLDENAGSAIMAMGEVVWSHTNGKNGQPHSPKYGISFLGKSDKTDQMIGLRLRQTTPPPSA